MCVCKCVSACECGACGSQKRVLSLWNLQTPLDLQTAVHQRTWVLGT